MRNLHVIIISSLIGSCYSKTPEKTGLEGKPLPSFSLLLPDSVTYFNTSSIPAGKPFVLLSVGPYCPYSRAQMEEIIDDMDQLKNIQFYVLTHWPFRDMKKFYSHYHLSRYPNVLTGYDYKNFFGDYYKIKGVPYITIFDKDKKLYAAFTGKIFSTHIKHVIEK